MSRQVGGPHDGETATGAAGAAIASTAIASTAIAGTLLPGFEGPVLPDWLAARLRAGLAGVCLFGTNIHSLDQLRRLTTSIRSANPHALIAIDEEGGDVTRLFYDVGSPWPGNAVLGRLDDIELSEQTAKAVGVALVGVGVNLDFAPDVDINSNDLNPVIGVRSFGATAEVVARHTRPWVRGLQSTAVAACAKHFPGHGDTTADSHLELPSLDLSLTDLRDREFEPFRVAIAAGTRTIMTSHILVPELDATQPATFSARILEGILREELGFEGVIVSDALDMAGASRGIGIPQAAVRALAGGCDLLCIGTGNTDEQLVAIEIAVATAVDEGRLSAARLTEASERVRVLAAELAASAPGTRALDRDEQPASVVCAEPVRPAESRGSATPPAAPATPATPATAASAGSARSMAEVFDYSAVARTALSGDAFRGENVCLVKLDTAVSPAVGDVPWGPFAVNEPSYVVTQSTARVTADALERLSNESPIMGIVIVGRSNHLEQWAREFIDTVRAHSNALAIDMGWPATDRRYADVATFGASRLIGQAVLAMLSIPGRDVPIERQAEHVPTERPPTHRPQTEHPSTELRGALS